MSRTEHDRLISENYIGRIAFKGDEYPYIGPFLYVFDGKFIYFLPTKYGKKIRYFQRNSYVTVEIEKYDPDFSNYTFVTLSGRLIQVEDDGEKKIIRDKFVHLIKNKKLSSNILIALGHSPEEPIEIIRDSERVLIWKLVDVIEITGLKSGTQ